MALVLVPFQATIDPTPVSDEFKSVVKRRWREGIECANAYSYSGYS
jgi:hypothetical protein